MDELLVALAVFAFVFVLAAVRFVQHLQRPIIQSPEQTQEMMHKYRLAEMRREHELRMEAIRLAALEDAAEAGQQNKAPENRISLH